MAARKYSRQRKLIKDFLISRKDHPTADTVYRSVQHENHNISLDGEIRRLDMGDGVDHFDADISPHYHFICRCCGSVIDLEMDNIETITERAAANFDGEIEGYVTYFYGICARCREKE